MIYWPKGDLNGVSLKLGQHMDIFPTIVDLIGYGKPFRSWGKSLISDTETDSFVVNYFGGGSYFMMNEDYTVVSNGEKITGFYNSNDRGLENNLINMPNTDMENLALKFQVFLEDYMNRVAEGDMFYNDNND